VPKRLKTRRIQDYTADPQTLGQHLKKRRRELGLLQREVAERLGCDLFAYLSWERDIRTPMASRFPAIIDLLGYDPTPPGSTLADRVVAKRRVLGLTVAELAKRLSWDSGTLTRYLNETWRIPNARRAKLEAWLGS